MTATPDRPQPLSLPALSIRLGVSLDLLRKRFKADPQLAALARVCGPARFIEPEDLPRVRELLSAR